MKQIRGEFLEFVLSSQNPAGSNDNVVVWVSDDNVLYMLSANTSLNYAGLSRKKDLRSSWESVLFVQSNQQEHVAALNWCYIIGSETVYAEELIMSEDGEETCESLDIAQLCVDHPESMRDYFMQWE
jgi:hypothetical protein